mmetsp:Transcript_17131/g.37139  ORF Transcript_17131/g.37139 Transcript_17131/m.37139 type:complete len:87 (-) Transcript_17131:3-263(-)
MAELSEEHFRWDMQDKCISPDTSVAMWLATQRRRNMLRASSRRQWLLKLVLDNIARRRFKLPGVGAMCSDGVISDFVPLHRNDAVE